jgi:hypothetical protein
MQCAGMVASAIQFFSIYVLLLSRNDFNTWWQAYKDVLVNAGAWVGVWKFCPTILANVTQDVELASSRRYLVL